MIDLTPLLRMIGPAPETADDATEANEAPDSSLPVQVQLDAIDATVDDHDEMLEALMAYLGLVWCPTCADMHQPDSHTLNPNGGTNMGYPTDGLPDAPLVGP